MNDFLLSLKRPFIWLRRFRHRCGYGVHSPFAFHFITGVIYEKTPYYKYAALLEEERQLAPRGAGRWEDEPLKVKRLLFRVANYARAEVIVNAGVPSAASLYLRAGRTGATYVEASSLQGLWLEEGVPVGLVYLHDFHHPEFVEEAFRRCVPHVCDRSVFVVGGIHRTARMEALWRQMREHGRTVVSFDLYDLGILFFDPSKQRQHYIVNF